MIRVSDLNLIISRPQYRIRQCSPGLASYYRTRTDISEVVPAPIVIPPSQYFEGADGHWRYNFDADYGLDTLGLGYADGANGPTLKNQTAAAYALASPLYIGVFGLSTQSVIYQTFGNISVPSFFSKPAKPEPYTEFELELHCWCKISA
ncbi:hypothetical protein DID88_008889 [Monilinia fructigena]|uniref:Uncharacterized protein n=1 Tax=Monilinia fructigena TaxID=38457 RepID=A0A395J6Q2_9HELO|nr:hypothetical protein DID88_008889 [Monilinia fructigena]